jgi:hypothetical protein
VRRLPLITTVFRWLYANGQDERLAGTTCVAGPSMTLVGLVLARDHDLLAATGLIVGGLVVFALGLSLIRAHNRLDDLQPRRPRRRPR